MPIVPFPIEVELRGWDIIEFADHLLESVPTLDMVIVASYGPLFSQEDSRKVERRRLVPDYRAIDTQ